MDRMSNRFFSVRTYLVPSLILAGMTLAAFCSCTSKGLAPVPKDVPFAENAPKTIEEEAYYQDVYSGDWRERPNPLGVFGLAKNSVDTKPPAHWNMAPPAGSKTMEQVYQENYARQASENQARLANSPNGYHQALPSGAVPAQNIPGASAVPQYNLPVNNTQNALPQNGLPQNTAPSASPIPGGYSPYAPADETPNNNQTAPYGAGNDSGNTNGYNNGAVAPNGYGKVTRNERNDFSTMIIRGQAPDEKKEPEPQKNPEPKNETDEQKKAIAGGEEQPLKIEPGLSERLGSADRQLLMRESNQPHLPQDEYIADGGDDGGEAYATPNWAVRHLEPEDTIAHFDTLDGRILVEPSNRVHLYAPRFGSIRQVVGPSSQSQGFRLAKTEQNIGPLAADGVAGIDVRSQEARADLTRANLQATGAVSNQPGGSLSGEAGLIETDALTRLGDMAAALSAVQMNEEQKAKMIDGSAAAAAWGEVQGVHVEIDQIAAQGNISIEAAESVFIIDTAGRTSQLSLIKVASKKEAQPGEIVEFTLRFENTGTDLIGNVTILDNLSARLEYVPNSAKSSKKGKFLADVNEVGSLLLRFEIDEPLQPKDFGVLTFLCKVR